ncbi:hypothetical protein HEK616_73250 [Streptomyces nigrescens]|uniref:Uncharacterized protein n=1 Tax=Streptomyces nigrescens TaxID=1920 RepID=A0ABN6RB21_STRNI|nr:hypothetical protein HEK616_73250 [Streptomyces nigrescens]
MLSERAAVSERTVFTESVAGSVADSDSGAGSDADSVTAVSPGSRYLDIWVPTGTGHVQSMGAPVIST